MQLTKIKISNYKSIKDAFFNVRRIDGSLTTVFVGKNGTGKSNLLQAIELLAEVDREYNYEALKNAQNDSSTPINIYYSFDFDSEEEWKNIFESKVIAPKDFLEKLEMKGIEKNVYLTNDSKKFKSRHKFLAIKSENFLSKYCFKKISHDGLSYEIVSEKEIAKFQSENEYKVLNSNEFNNILNDVFADTISQISLNVFRWKYSNEYLIQNDIDLNEFKEDPQTSIPLKNIFNIAGFNSEEEIKNKIESLLLGPKNINKLEKILENAATEHIHNIWPECGVMLKIKIQDDLKLSTYVVDYADEENSFYQSDRSDGFKQFLSLILGLSASNSSNNLRNQIIIIDEPETHMHPSGIKFMCEELLRIGRNNYVFLATHSQYIIDVHNKERHYITTKVNNNTNIHNWNSDDDAPDDEVLRQAFGLNVLSDIMERRFAMGEEMPEEEMYNRALKVLYPSKLNCLKEKILSGISPNDETQGINFDAVSKKISETAQKITQYFDSEKPLQMFSPKN